MNRRAAFTPLHHPHCERRRILPRAPEPRTLKRHECRAPNAEADTGALEREIEELVSALYGLTSEEKALVQAAAK